MPGPRKKPVKKPGPRKHFREEYAEMVRKKLRETYPKWGEQKIMQETLKIVKREFGGH